jgi:hypothetical protein
MPTAGALGDVSAVYADIPEWRRLIEAQNAYQRELRSTIAPGGLRAVYLDHLHALADETGTVLTLHHPRGFHALWVGQAKRPHLPGLAAQVAAPLPLTRTHYLTGLHEFGHIFNLELGGTSHHGATPAGVYGELVAHVWAFEHSKVPIAGRDVRDAEYLLYCAGLDAGWTGGPLADFTSALPRRLRRPYLDGLARLFAFRASRAA